MYDVIVIGAGPAGMAAGIYAAANNLKTLVITKELSVHEEGSFDILGNNFLSEQFQKNLKDNQKLLELKNKTEVINIEKNVVSFSVEIKSGEIIYCRSLVLASGKSDLIFDLLTYKAGTGRIKVDARMKTNVPGIFAIGDVNDSGSKNLLAAAGEGAKAALAAGEYLASSKK
jgi:thioredoxin reductase